MYYHYPWMKVRKFKIINSQTYFITFCLFDLTFCFKLYCNCNQNCQQIAWVSWTLAETKTNENNQDYYQLNVATNSVHKLLKTLPSNKISPPNVKTVTYNNTNLIFLQVCNKISWLHQVIEQIQFLFFDDTPLLDIKTYIT